MAEDQTNPKPGEEEEKKPEAENEQQAAGPDTTGPEQDTPEEQAAQPGNEAEAPVGEVPDAAPEQLAEGAPQAPAAEDEEQPVVEEPGEDSVIANTPRPEDEDPSQAGLEGTLGEQALADTGGQPQAPETGPQTDPQSNVFNIDDADEVIPGMEVPGVTPADQPNENTATADDGPDGPDKDPDGVSDLVGDKDGQDPADDTAQKFEDYKQEQERLEDEELRILNAREHFQKIMRSREGREEMDPDYLEEIRGLKYYPEMDALKINIGLRQNIMDSPNGVHLTSGFFTQEAAEMVMATVRTHEWSKQPIKLHGSKSQKNKLWLAAMRQGVEVDAAFQPTEKYLEKWKSDPLNPANRDDDPQADMYPGVSPNAEAAENSAEADNGPLAGEDAAKLDSGDPAGQEAAEQQLDSADPAEIEEYRDQLSERISATIEDLQGREDQQENVQALRETLENVQTGQPDAKTLSRVDDALFHGKYNVALAAVKPEDKAGAPVKSADIDDSATPAPAKPSNKSGMSV